MRRWRRCFGFSLVSRPSPSRRFARWSPRPLWNDAACVTRRSRIHSGRLSRWISTGPIRNRATSPYSRARRVRNASGSRRIARMWLPGKRRRGPGARVMRSWTASGKGYTAARERGENRGRRGSSCPSRSTDAPSRNSSAPPRGHPFSPRSCTAPPSSLPVEARGGRPDPPERERESGRRLRGEPRGALRLRQRRRALPLRQAGGNAGRDRAAPRRQARTDRPRLRVERRPAHGGLRVPRSRQDDRRGRADVRGGPAVRPRHEGRAGQGRADVRLPARPARDGRRVRREHRPRLRLQPEQSDRNDRRRRASSRRSSTRSRPRRVVLVDEAYHHFVDSPAYKSALELAPAARQRRRRPHVLEDLRDGRHAPRLRRGLAPRTSRPWSAAPSWDNTSQAALAMGLAALADPAVVPTEKKRSERHAPLALRASSRRTDGGTFRPRRTS